MKRGLEAMESMIDAAIDGEFEGFETDSFEDFEGLIRKVGAAKAGKLMQRMASKGAQRNNTPARLGGKMGEKIEAILNLTIERVTSTITQTLVVPVFGSMASESAFNNTVALGSGTVISNFECGVVGGTANLLQALVTYTNGANTDTVKITCTDVAYPELLKALITDMFRINRLRYSIDDVTKLQQLQTQLSVIERSLFGNKSQKTINLGTFNDPKDFKSNVIDIPVNIDVDKEILIGVGMIQSAPIVSMSLFIEWFDKHNIRSVGQ